MQHPERRLQEAVKFGLNPVIGPLSREREPALSAAPTLRGALKLAGAGAARRRAIRRRPLPPELQAKRLA